MAASIAHVPSLAALPVLVTGGSNNDAANPYVAYNSICLHVHRAVLKKLERRKEIHKRFIPYDATRHIIDEKLLSRFFTSLSTLDDTSGALPSVTRDDKLKRVKTRDLYGLLAVLLYSSCDIAAARAFHEHLVLVSEEIWDEIISERKRKHQSPLGKLPLEVSDAEQIFGVENIDILDNIASNQSIFCPVQLWRDGELTLDSSKTYRFPYIQEETIGEGSSGQVSRVVIAIGYFTNKEGDSGNLTEIALARKDYNMAETHRLRKLHLGTGRRIREEKEIIQTLNKFRGHDNIVKSFGAYEIGTIYSLFLEPAAADLKAYLSSRDERLTSSEAKATFLHCSMGLAGGLAFLHEGIRLPHNEWGVCWHLDLKPDNVLVFRSVNDGKETVVWKIGDFGAAVLKTRKDERKEVKRARKGFPMQKGSAFSGTQNLRLQGTYLAPESEISLPDMGAYSDVWSLGCIMSMLLTYLEAGWPGVRKYSDERCDERQVKQTDQFFRPPLGWADFKINPKVLDQHQYLIRQAQGREMRDEQALPGEGKAIKRFLEFLERAVLVTSWRQRSATAKDLEAELSKLTEFYANPASGEEDIIVGQRPSALNNLRLWSRNLVSRNREYKTLGEHEERPWFVIPRHTNIKASTVTLSGSIIAFWSNEYIRLYTPEMLNEERPEKGQLKSHGVSDKLGQNICYWESVDLNHECLLASTNRNNFDCYVFEIEDENVNGPTLHKKYRLFLQLPKIRRLSISPDNHWFVCVVSHEQGPDFPGTLLHARMDDVLDAAKMRSNVTEENIARRTPDLPLLVPWEESITLTTAAADLTCLTVSEGNIVFAVLQPSTYTEDNEHNIILHSFDILNRRFHTINLESPPLEYSTVSFFTAFAPFRNQNACAIVTREHRFHVQYFTDDTDPRDVVQSIQNYRLLEIVMDLDDETVFALGTDSANSDVWLLRFPLPKSDKDDIMIVKQERIHKVLYDDDCALSISLEGDSKYIVISVARGIMYRLNLSKPSE